MASNPSLPVATLLKLTNWIEGVLMEQFVVLVLAIAYMALLTLILAVPRS